MARLLEIVEKDAVGDKMPTKSFRLKHDLASHPLFSLDRLAKLAGDLPEGQVEWNGPVSPNQDPNLTPANGMSAEETVRRIEEAKSWMVLKSVEADPEYKALLDACLDEIAEQTGGVMGGAMRRSAFIFVTSPGNVTPMHTDPELNFLIQIRGNKRMSLWDQKDREVVAAENMEMYPGKHRNIPYKDEHEARALHQHLEPGDSIFVPLMAPHWVENGNEVSVSFSVTWMTPEAENFVSLQYVNAVLRKLGLPQAEPGEHKLWDSVKVAAYRVLRPAYDAIKKLVGDRDKAVALVFGRKNVEPV